MFAEEVMPEFHALEGEHATWKDNVLSGRLTLEDLETKVYDIFSHQNADIVRLTPEELIHYSREFVLLLLQKLEKTAVHYMFNLQRWNTRLY